MKRDEFFYLCALTGAKEIIGIKDLSNSSSLDQYELENHWLEIKESLQEKNYLDVKENKELVMDSLIRFLAEASCNPERVLIVSVSGNVEFTDKVNYYLHQSFALEIKENRRMKNGLILIPHGSAVSVLGSVLEVLLHEDYPSLESEQEEILFSLITVESGRNEKIGNQRMFIRQGVSNWWEVLEDDLAEDRRDRRRRADEAAIKTWLEEMLTLTMSDSLDREEDE